MVRYMASSSHEAGAGGRCAVLRKDWTTRVALDLRLSNSTLEMFSAMLRRPLVQDGIIDGKRSACASFSDRAWFSQIPGVYNRLSTPIGTSAGLFRSAFA